MRRAQFAATILIFASALAAPAAAQYGPRAGTYAGYSEAQPEPLPPSGGALRSSAFQGYSQPQAQVLTAPHPHEPAPPRGRGQRGLPVQPPALRGDSGGLTLMVGGGLLARPAYPGSDIYKVSAIPGIVVSYDDWFFADPAQGVGVRKDIFPGLQLSVGGDYYMGRQEEDESRLAGLGDLDGGPSAFASLEFRPLPGFLQALSAGIGVEAPITGDIDGAEVTADVGLALPIGAGGFAQVSLGTVWMSEEMMDDVFGVTAAQAATSAFTAYDPDGGLQAYRLSATALRPIWGNVNIAALVGYDRLVGDAARSPIVESRDQYRVGAGLLYQFGN